MDDLTPASAPQALLGPRSAPELSVVVPTFGERDNVPLLIEKLRQVLAGVHWEVLFVDDDSPDGTAAAARAIGATDARVRCIRRIGRRGLAGACIEGMLASQARFIAVMDADLQHDEWLLPEMLARLRQGADLAVASRYLEQGSAAGLSSRGRAHASSFSTVLSQRLLGVTLSDPMSGFFMIRRERFEELAPRLSTQGFKILLDLVVTARGTLHVVELPFVFGQRQHGESKLDERAVLDFGALLLAKLTDDRVSSRFLLFCMIGVVTTTIHMAVLPPALAAALSFGTAQTVAAMLAICGNFLLHNMIIYRDRRLRGWRFVTGLVRFQLMCAAGTFSNVAVASLVYARDPSWWIAGLCGALVGAVWTSMVGAVVMWRER